MNHRRNAFHAKLFYSAAMLSLAAFTQAATAETANFTIPPQSLDGALRDFGRQSGHGILINTKLTDEKKSPGLFTSSDPEDALQELLKGSGLTYRRNGDVFAIVSAGEPIRPSVRAPIKAIAAETVSGSAVEGLVVTAQKRREQIQDVPIAISAFSADALQAQKIEGGFDLLKAIPNVTFSKNNFSGYNFSIRGIGTKAISVTTDPGVAVEFNDTPLIRNRLFEQEYFDIERVEVLRGPQGTLHGRNATAGVINVISEKPDLGVFEGRLKAEIGNYGTRRLSGAINVPLIPDVLAARFAGAITNREGYDFNTITENPVNGRELWSGRLTIGFAPTDALHADFIWEHFNEDDNRSRTGKQLCTRDPGASTFGAVTNMSAVMSAYVSQGCKSASLFDKAAFGTPNGLTIPFLLVAAQRGGNALGQIGLDPNDIGPDGRLVQIPLVNGDPYGGLLQTPDLREIASLKDPIYRAETDVFELNITFDVTPSLTFTSQTAYARDSYYSAQDFNRFNTLPVFNSTDGLVHVYNESEPAVPVTPNGVFCDPQLGCSNTIVGFDISRARSTQFSQEFRLQSSFDGPFNFSAGVNYTRYRTVEDYFVLFNAITAIAAGEGYILGNYYGYTGPLVAPEDLLTKCAKVGVSSIPVPIGAAAEGPWGTAPCIYIDTNPFEQINGEGHNYFRSQNPYTLKSTAAFGEIYWQMLSNVKITSGLRYSDDRKIVTPVPSQTLLAFGFLAGDVNRGYPAQPDIKQHWGEVSGRIGIDWKPDLSFTDDTMIYAFYSRGYKGGGVNPPGVGFSKEDELFGAPIVRTLPYPETFRPEFVNAFELGAKNTLLGGSVVFNAGAFFYDYKDYQVSQIKSRTAVNENFDAKVWGTEIETVWQPTIDTRFNLALGYQGSKLADGARSIDLMDRIQGHTEYTTLKPSPQLPDNCVVLRSYVEPVLAYIADGYGGEGLLGNICPGHIIFNASRLFPIPDSAFPNDGLGFFDDISGNELPNAPHWTVSLGGQQTFHFLEDWEATARADAYWQAQSWHRVYNTQYDKLHGWYNTNLSFWIEKPEEDLKIEFYVKNVLDDTPITDAFLNSDDTALTTNVFTLDPRLIGLQITKGF